MNDLSNILYFVFFGFLAAFAYGPYRVGQKFGKFAAGFHYEAQIERTKQ
ncbi:hypothetical protein KMP13_03225 [Epibacterium ulvae]|nr:hypothetical protein [Epibacterium ulvae]MBT8152914.1 hypothetical protein [Epibacterium ulvae]